MFFFLPPDKGSSRMSNTCGKPENCTRRQRRGERHPITGWSVPSFARSKGHLVIDGRSARSVQNGTGKGSRPIRCEKGSHLCCISNSRDALQKRSLGKLRFHLRFRYPQHVCDILKRLLYVSGIHHAPGTNANNSTSRRPKIRRRTP